MEISKSKFKPKAFEYIRMAQKAETEVRITDHGKTVVRLLPCAEDADQLAALRGRVTKYKNPLDPVEVAWETTT